MMMEEFEKLTGVEPTIDEYAEIEKEYMNQDKDKYLFCEEWVKNGGEANLYKTRIKKIEELKKKLKNIEKEKNAEIEMLRIEKEKLKTALDKELEWKPAKNVGTIMDQERYIELLKEGTMNEEKAKELIEEWFGFKYEKIRIIKEAATFEVNKYRRCRIKEIYNRQPVYSATDWNYIRFDVNCLQYEMVNGELYQYCD